MRYAISDIHGCVRTFRQALDHINLAANDELFLLGDYIDRGPDSQGVIDLILELQRNGQAVVCLAGNHEEMLLDFYHQRRGLYEWQPEATEKAAVWTFLESLPSYHETPGYLLIHAGLNFLHADPLADEYAMRWERKWYRHINYDWLGDRIIIHGHTPVSLSRVKEGIAQRLQRQVVCIDSGCAYPQHSPKLGYLTVLNLDTGEGHHLKNIDAAGSY